jgi:hypothetical protein
MSPDEVYIKLFMQTRNFKKDKTVKLMLAESRF